MTEPQPQLHTESHSQPQPQPETDYNYDVNEFEESETHSPERQQNIMQNRLDQKKNYLKHLKLTSKQLAHEIKEINAQLDKKMSKLVDKQLSKKQNKQPKQLVDADSEKKLQERYKELDMLRQQVKKIKAKEFNVQFAVDRMKQLKGQLKLQVQQIDKLNKEYTILKRASCHQPQNQSMTASEDDNIPVYTEQISRLKEKIKEITNIRQHQTEQLLEVGRRQKQEKAKMPLIDRSKSTPKNFLMDDNINTEVIEAKRKYEEIGRKLEILRVRRNILLQEDNHLQDRIKLLQSYKIKYEEMKKINETKNKPVRKYVIKAEHKHPQHEQEQNMNMVEEPVSEEQQVIHTQSPTKMAATVEKTSREMNIQEDIPYSPHI